jgi:RND family efflux transporter MFP subunit
MPRSIWIGLTALALVAPASMGQGGGPPPAMVVLDPVQVGPVEQWRQVTGELRAIRRASVASRQAGQVVDLLLEEGGQVRAGDVIARLDDSLATLEVARSRAQLAADEAAALVAGRELERWTRDWQRYEKLEGGGTVSASEIDQVRAQVAVGGARVQQAQADVGRSRAALALAEESLAQRTIRAPFDGRVVRKMTDVGQWVAEGGPVAEIMVMDELEARLDVPEALASRLREGDSAVRIRLTALWTEVTGTVRSVMPGADDLSRLFPVRVVLRNDGSLRPGMSIVGLLATGQQGPAMTVHKDGILRDDAGEFLYWDAGGVAMVARIKTLFAVGDRVAVQASLPPTAKVIVHGNERIMFPGQPIMDTRASPGGAGGPGSGGPPSGGPPGGHGGAEPDQAGTAAGPGGR